MTTVRTVLYDASELVIAAIIITMFISVGSGIAKDDAYQKKYLANYIGLSFDAMMAVNGDVAANTNIISPTDYTIIMDQRHIQVNRLNSVGKPAFWGYFHPSNDIIISSDSIKSSNLAIIKEGGLIRIDEKLDFKEFDLCPKINTADNMADKKIYLDIGNIPTLLDIGDKIKKSCNNCIFLTGKTTQDKITQLQNPDMIILIRMFPDVIPRIISSSNDKGLKLGCLMVNLLSQEQKIGKFGRSIINSDEIAENNYMKIMSNDVPSVSIELNLGTDPLTSEENKNFADLIITAVEQYYQSAQYGTEDSAAQQSLIDDKDVITEDIKKSEPQALIISG